MADLTPNQLRLLRELDFYGGILILRTRTDEADYEVLEKSGFVSAFAINISEIRYKITAAGRAALLLFSVRFSAPSRHNNRRENARF